MTIEHKRNYGLDLMRSIAIGGVLLGHLFKFLTPLASLGVELFFVLSGFLIGGIFLRIIEKNNGLSFKEAIHFLQRRWFRTIPNYYLFLIINFVCFKYFIGEQLLPNNFISYVFFVQNLAWSRDFFFSESWSLCVEEWFYLCLPFSFLFLHTILRKTHPQKIFVFLSLMFIMIPTFLRFNADSYNDVTRLIVIYRLDSIMYGVLFSFIKAYQEKMWRQFESFSPIALILFVTIISINFLSQNGAFISLRILDTISPLIFVFTIPFFYRLSRPTNEFAVKAITKTSLWSYSLYLVHLPLLLSSRTFIEPFLNSSVETILYRSSILILSFILSWMIYTYYESPMTQLREKL